MISLLTIFIQMSNKKVIKLVWEVLIHKIYPQRPEKGENKTTRSIALTNVLISWIMCSKPLSEMRRCKNNTNCYVNKIIKMITSQARQIFLNKCKHFIGCLSHSLVTISYHFLRNITFQNFALNFLAVWFQFLNYLSTPKFPVKKNFPKFPGNFVRPIE